MTITRRKWLSRLALYGTPVAAFSYGSLIERRWVGVNHTVVPIPEKHRHLNGLKVAVMGDFHHDDYGDDQVIGSAVKAINEESVDLVMLVGDYISSDCHASTPLCHELQNLRARIGVFGILGNHDCWHLDPLLFENLREAGVRLLVNETVEFDEFAITGLDSHWGGRPALEWATKSIPENKPTLLGWHEPDTFDFYDQSNVILQMSGHTHGGQVCAPAVGPILLPQYGKKYPYGLYRKQDRSLFVTRGMGTLSIPTRFLCRPEVAILTLSA